MTDFSSQSRPGSAAAEDPAVSQIRQEYADLNALFNAQPGLVQRFIEGQARQLAEALDQDLPQVRFSLPDRVVFSPSSVEDKKTHPVPPDYRDQLAGGLLGRLTRTDLRTALRQRLNELEGSQNRAVAASAALLRHATAIHLVHVMLPDGRSVKYRAEEGEQIPSIPLSDGLEPASALLAATDAVTQEEPGEAGRGELLVPYVPAARRFYLPQWVAFDDQGNLIVNSVNAAQASVASMQRFLRLLHAAVSLAPHIVADEVYQQKRYGMLGQLVNQGRALALYQVDDIIATIKRRAAAHDLNRGLSLSLPYFDDQDLELRTRDFEIIPAGRIMFVPAFVVRAARQEQAKVAQDTRLSASTRKHLMVALRRLEKAFDLPVKS
jgi:hypothetical protein